MALKVRKKTAGLVCFIIVFLTAASVVGYFGVGYFRKSARAADTAKVIVAQSAQQIAEHIISEVNIRNIVQLQNEQISNYYGVPMHIVQQAAVYKSTSATTADELAVFWVGDRGTAEIVTSAVDGRISECKSAYSTLNAEENRKVENCLVVASGDYIIMVICADTETAADAIAEFYQ